MFLSGVPFSSLFALCTKAGFCGFRFFRCGFNEADFPGFELITYPDD
jgi:hypothetical protein